MLKYTDILKAAIADRAHHKNQGEPWTKIASMLKRADPPRQGVNNPLYRRTGVDPAMPGAKDAYWNNQKMKAQAVTMANHVNNMAGVPLNFGKNVAGLTPEGRGVYGEAFEGFANTVPGIAQHVADIPQYAYRLPAMVDKAVMGNDGNKVPGENFLQRTQRQWNDTATEMRNDDTFKYLAKPGDAFKKNVTDPIARGVHAVNPVRNNTEQLRQEHSAAASTANFGGNALGWAALPGAASATGKAISKIPGKAGQVITRGANAVGTVGNAIASDGGVFDAGNVLKAVPKLSPYADQVAWGGSVAKHVGTEAGKASGLIK